MMQVRVWDVATLQCLATLTGHSGAVRALAASPDRVFSGSDDTTIKVCAASPFLGSFCFCLETCMYILRLGSGAMGQFWAELGDVHP